MAQTGGLTLKLQVNGNVPGYHLFWENDEDNALESRLYEGFEFVSPAEVRMQSAVVADADLGDKVSKYVGKKADGSPLRAYLLKYPEDLWEEMQDMKQRQANEWDSAIRANTLGGLDKKERYNPKGADTVIKTI